MITYCSCTRAAPRPRALAQPAARIDRGAHTGPPQPPQAAGPPPGAPAPCRAPSRRAAARHGRGANDPLARPRRRLGSLACVPVGVEPRLRRSVLPRPRPRAPRRGPSPAARRPRPAREPSRPPPGRRASAPHLSTAGVAPRRSASARGARRHAAHAPRRAGHCAPNRCPRVKPARPKPRAIGTTTAERLLRSMRPPRPPKLTIAHKACFLAASHAAAAASFCAAPPQRARSCPGPLVLGRAPTCARQRRRDGRRTNFVRPSLRYIGILGPRSRHAARLESICGIS